ncbi:MAG: hypothetical protein ACTS5I_12505 [Rhodanobacter sp.]
MNPMNEILRSAACKAVGAIFFLDDAGATVTSIEVRGGRPLIRMDGAPDQFIQGAIRKSQRVGMLRECVMVAMVHGCQVEWLVHTRCGDVAAQAGA